MTKEEFEESRAFVRGLAALRLQLADGVLLDRCQMHLTRLIGQLADNFEDYPPENHPAEGHGIMVEGSEEDLAEVERELAETSPHIDEEQPPEPEHHVAKVVKKRSHHKKAGR